MIRKTFVAAAATTLTLTGAGVALAAGSPASSQAGGGPVAKASPRTDLTTISSCNGGKQKRTYTRINSSANTFGEGADFAVPGVAMKVKGPAKGRDTLNLTFSAETQLRGNKADDKFDWIELEVLLDGTPITPSGPSVDPLALGGSPYYESNAAQFCTRIGPGWHTVRVVTRLVDNGTDDTLRGWIDDAVLNAVVSQ